ncbi:MAG TPA: hypothetical protein ENF73_06020, partial [Proteobacteria bacterium]|nr:hypothetical protein [Pseudomonadota bacterium]
MRRMMIATVSAVVFALVIVGFAYAQQSGKSGQDKRPLEMLEWAKLWKLTEFLELDEQRAAKLFPVLASYDRKIMAKANEKLEVMRKLKAHFDGITPLSRDELTRMSKRLWEIDKEIAQLQIERFDAIAKILSPEEAARYSA